MNAEEARLIVQCRRPCGRDDHDPVIREALDMVLSDAEAAAHMHREANVDAAISERLRTLTAPPDLLNRIMAGARVTRRAAWWRRPIWLAAAAAIAVSTPIVVSQWPRSPVETAGFASVTLADFRAATTAKLNDGPKLQRLASMESVREHLAGNSKMKTIPVPDNLCHCPGGTVGCEVFAWNGREVTLICFNAGKPGTVHLFTVDASALRDSPGGPIYQPLNGWQTRTWVESGKVLMLAGSASMATAEDLEQLASSR